MKTKIEESIEILKTNKISDKEIVTYLFLKFNSSKLIELNKLKSILGNKYLDVIKSLCEKNLLSCNLHNNMLEIENIENENVASLIGKCTCYTK